MKFLDKPDISLLRNAFTPGSFIPKWTILDLIVLASLVLVYDAKRPVWRCIARYMGSANQLLQCAVRLSIWWRW
jgi:hypothetical protein